MGKYPDKAVEILESVSEQLDQQFNRVWRVLSPSIERDEVMWHIISAKRDLNVIIKEEKQNG